MSQNANYFKLGLFVIGAIAAGIIVLMVIGTGRWLKPRTTIETYFNESVQGLDLGSKMKYRGVVIGQVTRITFTYVEYEQDKPMNQRKRYVLVQAQIEPRLVGGRAANDIASRVNAASEIVDRLRNLQIEKTIATLNRLLETANTRVAGLDTAAISEHAQRTMSKLDATLDGIQSRKLSNEAAGLIAELRQTNGEIKSLLANPALAKLPADTSATLASVRELVANPALPQSIAHLERTLARLDRIFGGGEADLATTFQNLRQITDNLRDLTEDAKRYPSNVLFGAPPRRLEPAQ
jgi:hypothetical protein